MTAAIDVKGLVKTYKASAGGRQEALRGVDLTVEANELFGFVGVNGAGKSTFIKSLVGLVRPDGGEASVFGFPAGTTEARARLGYLPEVSNYHEFLSAKELLSIHAALAGVPSSQRGARCEEVLSAVGLQARMKTRIADFSKGMKQRFGIAQAMVGNPPLLILDELTSGLDPLAQRELKEIMTALRQKGCTIFFSSHHMTEVEAVCDRVAILHRGKLRAVGRLDELLVQSDQVLIQASMPAEKQGLASEQFPGVKREDSGRLQLCLAKDDVSRFLDFISHQQGELVSLMPSRLTLEEFYFRVVQQANKDDGVADIPAGDGSGGGP